MIKQQLDLIDPAVPWLDFMYDLDFLFDYLNRLHWKGNLQRYRCEWSDRMITTWGCCYPTLRLIRVSTFFRSRPLPELIAVLCHEMIHIRYRGHGKAFKRELKRVGLEGDVEGLFPHLTPLTNERRRVARYLYECPKCKARIHRRKRIRGYCLACSNTGINSRFRLVSNNPSTP